MIHPSTFTLRRNIFAVLFLFCTFLCANAQEGKNIARGLKVVVIDAGHGGAKFPGANYKGVCEKDINLKVALELGRLIEKEMPAVKVVYTRKTDKQFSTSLTADLQARADIANGAGGDLFISIHANAARSAAARGVETLIMGESPLETRVNENVLYANNKEEFLDMADRKTAAIVRAYIQNLQFTYGEYSEAMARIVQNNYAKAGRRQRGIKRQPLKVLYATDMPGILTEVGFMSNPEELAYMTSKKGQQEIARALCNAVKDYAAYVKGTLLVEELPAGREDGGSEAAAGEVSAEAAAEAASSTGAKSPAAQSAPADCGYTIQLFASARRVAAKSSELKSYRGKAREFVGGGRFCYKYCVGSYATADEAKRHLAAVRREFKDAYVVRYEGDKLVNKK